LFSIYLRSDFGVAQLDAVALHEEAFEAR
jgi:hypothetical protein